VWLPTGNGRMDMLGNTMGEKLAASQTLPDGSALNWSVDRMQSNVRIDAVAAASLGTIVRAALDMVPIAMSAQHSGHPPAGLPPEARKAARTLVVQLRDLWSGFELSETLEGMRIEAEGNGASIAKLAIGAGAGVRQGKLDMHVSLAIDGVDSPEIPAGPLREYLPRHIRLKPRLFGVPIADATRLLLRAIDSDAANGNELSNQATALLRRAPVTVGVDDVELDLGAARLRGGGELRIAAANNMSGEAEITVTGLDALIRQASATAELKQGLPFLVMLKGLGRQDGDDTHWKISYSGKKVMVNDNDLSAMLPGSR
jgi:hypothetical protein